MAAHPFAAACHSTDIAAQFGSEPDLCVYAGVPAAMFLANADPEADLAVMRGARENLRRIAPKAVALISSIAVYADSRGKTERMTPRGRVFPPMAATGCSLSAGCGKIFRMR